MIGLILNIIFIILEIFTVIYIVNKRKKIDADNEYEFMTNYPKYLLVLSYIFLAITLFLQVISIILYFSNEVGGMWGLFGFGLFMAILTLIIFYDLLLDYEAIKGYYLYISRFFKVNEIEISSLSQVIKNERGNIFYDKNGKKLFSMDSSTKGFYEFERLIEEKLEQLRTNVIIIDNNNVTSTKKEYIPSSNAVFKEIGEKRKEKLDQTINIWKKIIIISLIISILVIFFSIYFELNAKIIIFSVLLFFCIYGGCIGAINKLKKEKEMKDTSLGKKYYFFDKRVIGSGVYRYRQAKISLIVIAGCCYFISAIIGLVLLTEVDITKEELQYVSGKVEYVDYYYYDDSDYFVIGLENDEIEYRLPGVVIDSLDIKEIEQEIQKGDQLTLAIDVEYRDSNSRVDDSKTKWTYVYEMFGENNNYFTFEHYLIEEEKDDLIGLTAFIITFVLGSGFIGVLIWYKNKIKIDIENESLTAYKLN